MNSLQYLKDNIEKNGISTKRRGMFVKELICESIFLDKTQLKNMKIEYRNNERKVYWSMYLAQKQNLLKTISQDEYSRQIFVRFEHKDPCMNYIHIMKTEKDVVAIINWRSSEFQRIKEDVSICMTIIEDLNFKDYSINLLFNNVHIYQKNYSKLFFIEGVDCSGKDLFDKKLQEMLEYKISFFNRSPLSNIVYNIYYNRSVDHNKVLFDKLVYLLNNDFFLIYLSVKDEILAERFKSRGDEIHKDFEEILKIKSIYEIVIGELKKHTKNIICLENNKKSDFEKSYNILKRFCE